LPDTLAIVRIGVQRDHSGNYVRKPINVRLARYSHMHPVDVDPPEDEPQRQIKRDQVVN